MTTEADSPEDGATLAALERALPRVRPPEGLLDRILAEVSPEARVVPLRRTPRARRLLAPLAGAAAAVAAVAVLAVVLGDGGGASPAARAAIAGGAVPEVEGEALLYEDAGAGVVRVTLRNVPPAPAGHHYEVWVLPRGGDAMESLGTFTESGERVELELELPGPGSWAAIDVSVEEDGGPPAHSDTSLAGGVFE